jgi:hypothetical protein
MTLLDAGGANQRAQRFRAGGNEVSREYVLRALKQTGNKKIASDKLLGFSNYQMQGNWMKRLDIENEESTD